MTRGAFYLAGTVAALVAIVYFLVRMGAPGWFTLTIALAFVAATIAFLAPAIVILVVAAALFRFATWRAARGARR